MKLKLIKKTVGGNHGWFQTPYGIKRKPLSADNIQDITDEIITREMLKDKGQDLIKNPFYEGKTNMTAENKKILVNRTKSFLWRLGGMLAVYALDFLAQQLNLFSLDPAVVVVVGLVVGEITKAIRQYLGQVQ